MFAPLASTNLVVVVTTVRLGILTCELIDMILYANQSYSWSRIAGLDYVYVSAQQSRRPSVVLVALAGPRSRPIDYAIHQVGLSLLPRAFYSRVTSPLVQMAHENIIVVVSVNMPLPSVVI